MTQLIYINMFSYFKVLDISQMLEVVRNGKKRHIYTKFIENFRPNKCLFTDFNPKKHSTEILVILI